jgi:hypothetical protein
MVIVGFKIVVSRASHRVIAYSPIYPDPLTKLDVC